MVGNCAGACSALCLCLCLLSPHISCLSPGLWTPGPAWLQCISSLATWRKATSGECGDAPGIPSRPPLCTTLTLSLLPSHPLHPCTLTSPPWTRSPPPWGHAAPLPPFWNHAARLHCPGATLLGSLRTGTNSPVPPLWDHVTRLLPFAPRPRCSAPYGARLLVHRGGTFEEREASARVLGSGHVSTQLMHIHPDIVG